MREKRSFFERLTGTVRMDDGDFYEDVEIHTADESPFDAMQTTAEQNEAPDGELTVDVYQTEDDIIVETMVAGVKPDDLEVSISRDSVTIRGTRHKERRVSDEDVFLEELYWGSFSRTLTLPEEIIPEEAEAVEKHGLLTLRLPKIDRKRKLKLNVKSL